MSGLIDNLSNDVSQISIKVEDTSVEIKNETGRTWFNHRFTLTDKQIFDKLRGDLTRKRDLFLGIVFYKLKEVTNVIDENHRHYENIKVMRKEIHDIYYEFIQKHEFDIQKLRDYEKEIPEVNVSFDHTKGFRISSEMFSDHFYLSAIPRPADQTPIDVSIEKIKRVKWGIKHNFRLFKNMVYCIIERKIKRLLVEIDRTSLNDPILLEVKNKLDERVNKPISELRAWINNNKGIPGAGTFTSWNLRRDGRFTQVYITKLLKDDGTFNIVGVENTPNSYGKNPITNKQYDVDIEVEYKKSKIPVQVYVREGELSRRTNDAVRCIGEKLVSTSGVMSEYGGVDINYGKAEDYSKIITKLSKTPPGGVLLIISNPFPSHYGIHPLKEWWHNKVLDDKCIMIRRRNETTIYFKLGFDTKIVEKMAQSLGSPEIKLQTDSDFTLCDNFTDEQILQLVNSSSE